MTLAQMWGRNNGYVSLKKIIKTLDNRFDVRKPAQTASLMKLTQCFYISEKCCFSCLDVHRTQATVFLRNDYKKPNQHHPVLNQHLAD